MSERKLEDRKAALLSKKITHQLLTECANLSVIDKHGLADITKTTIYRTAEDKDVKTLALMFRALLIAHANVINTASFKISKHDYAGAKSFVQDICGNQPNKKSK